MRALTVVITLLLVCATLAHAADAPRPNVILMMADDQGWGDVGYNGHPELKTPHLDRMASEGVTFTRFYSANAMCSPTRGSIYTGRHPHRYGITFAMKGMLEPGEVVLTSVLKRAGYATGHFGKWHMGTLSTERGDQRRWGAFAKKPKRYYCPPWERDVDTCFVTESKVPTWNPMLDPGPIRRNTGDRDYTSAKQYGNEYFTGPDETATENLRGDDSRVIMDRAIPFIRDAVDRDRPFLAVIWFHAPHSPVVAGPKHRALYKHLDENKQHYYGCITALDEQVGRLRDELEHLGVADDTMLWYCSDNGPARQGSPRHVGTAKNLRGYKLSLREGGIRVPGLLVWPKRFPEPKTVDTPCVTSDYFPTILAALDIALPEDRVYDGRNLLPLIEQADPRPKGIGFVHGKQQAWIEHRYKLYTRDGRRFELYDLIADPGEQGDLSTEKPQVTTRMKEQLDTWRNGVMADLAEVE